jgi:integrase
LRVDYGEPRGRAVVTGGAGTAARVVELLGGIYSWGEKRELVPSPNPVHSVETARGEAKDRVLSAEELQALGKALDASEAKMPMAIAALKLIALTGLRREEACALRWSEIDLAGFCLRLESTKTGRSTRPIGEPARDLLHSPPPLSDEWVFPNRSGTARAELKASIAALFDAASLKNARSHDLRRTLAASRPMKVTAMRRSPNCSAIRAAASRNATISAGLIRRWSRRPIACHAGSPQRSVHPTKPPQWCRSGRKLTERQG